jgi:cardiolipin synthase A/B
LNLRDAKPERRAAWFSGGHQVRLFEGGSQWFPALREAIDGAQHEVWLATYIFHDDPTAQQVAAALKRAATRGVTVGVVVDGFGSAKYLARIADMFKGTRVQWVTFRPLHRWYAYLIPGQMRRLHQKLCSIDGTVAYVGGINVIDDRLDVQHGVTERPRLDYAVEVKGPVAVSVEQTVKALWTRATLGVAWHEELWAMARSSEPVNHATQLIQRVRVTTGARPARSAQAPLEPVRVALLIRDNVRQRRAIERAYIAAFDRAQRRIDLVSPYFFPGRPFRRALMGAARRGVQVRVLLQGKVDYRLAAAAARALYDEMLDSGIQIHEYTHAFLHAKIAVVDDVWATVGSSNIDPMSLLLNLEANVVVDDEAFALQLRQAIDGALSRSVHVQAAQVTGWAATVRRGLLATLARWYLRLAGVDRRY